MTLCCNGNVAMDNANGCISFGSDFGHSRTHSQKLKMRISVLAILGLPVADIKYMNNVLSLKLGHHKKVAFSVYIKLIPKT